MKSPISIRPINTNDIADDRFKYAFCMTFTSDGKLFVGLGWVVTFIIIGTLIAFK